jgi:hypothetical protein
MDRLTSHVETCIALLDIHSASRTILAVALHPVLSLLVVGVAMLTLRVVLVTGEAVVPWDLVRKAHFEFALVAAYVRIWIFVLLVDLPTVTGAI